MDLKINREDSITEKNSIESKEVFSLLTGYIYAVNTVVGAGFLSIPWAYDNAGWLFSLCYQIMTSVHCLVLSLQLLESISRAEVLLRMTESGKDIHPIPLKKLLSSPKSEALIPPPHLTPTITTRVINTPTIVKLVFGERASLVYFCFLVFYMIGIMVAYGSVFSSSFASNVPMYPFETCDIYSSSGFLNSCRVKYWIYLALFAAITIYMTLIGMEEQKSWQQLMSFLRFLVMSLIIVTCLSAIGTHTNLSNDGYNDDNFPPPVRGVNIRHAIPIILFASCYQTMVPVISENVREKSKNLKKIQVYTVLTCFGFYTALGIIVSVAVDKVPSMTSLSFRNYSGGYSQDDRPWWAYIIEYLVIISPALDVLSIFPMAALTVSGSIIDWKYGSSENADIKIIMITRLIVCIIPISISFFVYDLGAILDWVGIIVFFIVYIPFPLLHLGLKHLVPGKSEFDIYGNAFINISLSIFSILLALGIVAMNIATY